MGRGAARAGCGLLAVVLASGCTGDDKPSATPESSPPASTAPRSPTTPDEPTSDEPTAGETDGAGHTQPWVVVSSLRQPRLHLTLSEARGLAHGRAAGALRSIRREVGDRVTLYRSAADPVGAVARARSPIAVVPADDVRPTVQTALVAGVDPLRSPRRYPLRFPSDQPQPTVTTLRFVGDIMLGRGVAAARPHDPGTALQPYAPLLQSADITEGNLESTLSTDGRPRQGDDSFAASPSVVPDLERAGFDLLSLANNHTGDYGPLAFRQTLDRLDRSEIAHVGAGRDATQAWSPVIVRRHGLSFGFLAFNAIGETPRATDRSAGAAEIRMPPRTGPLNAHDLAKMADAVRDLAARVDVVTVLPHWGDQYTRRALPAQREVARTLVDAGADLVVGGHPHWVQGMASRRGSVVAYSLGNFVFDMFWSQQTMEGIALDVVFWGDRL